jgi:glycosyltransferase involved in cell wall biosynthesis
MVFDLRFATDHFPGIGTHAFQLLMAILERGRMGQVDVLWNPNLPNGRFDTDLIRRHAAVRWTTCDFDPMDVRDPWRLGMLLKRIDGVYLSPFYVMPAGWSGPAVITLHDVLPIEPGYEFGWRSRLFFQAAMHSARRARFVITSSAYGREQILRRTRIAPDRVRVIAPGIPSSTHRGDAMRPPAAPAGPFALVVGINKPHKNLATLARAWALLGERPPLALVGAGPRERRFPSLEDLAAQEGARSVHVLGRVAAAELAWLYSNASLVLFPSRHEGFGFPLLEAMAAGLPSIASDIPSLRELGGEGVIFVDACDDKAWATAIMHLAANLEARERLGSAARERSTSFDYSSCAEQVLDLVEQAGS